MSRRSRLTDREILLDPYRDSTAPIRDAEWTEWRRRRNAARLRVENYAGDDLDADIARESR